MYDQTYDYTGPLAAMIYKGINLMFGRSTLAIQILSSLLIIVQAGIFNALLLKNKVYDENSYLPAFLYVIVAGSVPDFMALSPQLMSLTFILFVFRNVIRRIDNQVTDELFISSGIFIGIASMIYLPAAIFFFVFLFSLILFSTAIPRRLGLYFYGFILIIGLCGFYYYLKGSQYQFLERAISQGFSLEPRIKLTYMQLLNLAAPFVAILLLSYIKKSSSGRRNNFQQKVEQVIWIMFLGSLSTFLFSNEKSGHELLFLVPVIAYFWTHFFILLKKRVFVLIMPGLLVFGLLTFSGYAYQNLTQPILIEERKGIGEIMVLGEELEVYLDMSVSTPCFNSTISGDMIEEINTYEGADNFHDIFQKTEPTYIKDQMGIMPQLMSRFPYLEKSYQKTGSNMYQKISN